MTNDDIMKLTPEELRLAIAKARGWVKNPLYDPLHKWIGPGPLFSRNDPPDWPKDMNDAWKLFEEIGAGSNVEISNCGTNNGEWLVYVEPEGVLIAADTAPVAICKAWLSWNPQV